MNYAKIFGAAVVVNAEIALENAYNGVRKGQVEHISALTFLISEIAFDEGIDDGNGGTIFPVYLYEGEHVDRVVQTQDGWKIETVQDETGEQIIRPETGLHSLITVMVSGRSAMEGQPPKIARS